jgi:hypothetical protein
VITKSGHVPEQKCFNEKSRQSKEAAFKIFTCFFGSPATCYFHNGSVSFVSLKFLPSLPFRKQADLSVSDRQRM